MLFGVDPSDLAGPLVQFQATSFSKEEVHKLIRTVNQQLDGQALESKVLDNVFDKWWPDLENRIQQILANQVPAKDANVRSEREIMEEILQLTRTFSIRTRNIAAHEGESRPSNLALHSIEVINLLMEYGRILIANATVADEINNFLPLAVEVTNLTSGTMRDVTTRRSNPKVVNMLNSLQKRANELADEIPF